MVIVAQVAALATSGIAARPTIIVARTSSAYLNWLSQAAGMGSSDCCPRFRERIACPAGRDSIVPEETAGQLRSRFPKGSTNPQEPAISAITIRIPKRCCLSPLGFSLRRRTKSTAPCPKRQTATLGGRGGECRQHDPGQAVEEDFLHWLGFPDLRPDTCCHDILGPLYQRARDAPKKSGRIHAN